MQNTNATDNKIVTILNEIFNVQDQIIKQFPSTFQNILENTQTSTTIHNLNIILLQHQVALYNIRELEDLESKIIYFRTMLDSNLPSNS